VITLCSIDDLVDGGVRRFDVDGRSLAVVRLGDDVYVLGDRCSHADVSLSDGEVDEDECTLECPKHGSQFDLRTGEALTLPATRPVPVYEVSVVDGMVQLAVAVEEVQ
jgi:3-phenylpropionate/trans-cinnamate dioxygenase ferredoxin subunit